MIQKWQKYRTSDKLHRRVNKGIPNSVRGEVWKHVLNLEGIKQPGLYEVSREGWEVIARRKREICCLT